MKYGVLHGMRNKMRGKFEGKEKVLACLLSSEFWKAAL